jgi:hypothetical protein
VESSLALVSCGVLRLVFQTQPRSERNAAKRQGKSASHEWLVWAIKPKSRGATMESKGFSAVPLSVSEVCASPAGHFPFVPNSSKPELRRLILAVAENREHHFALGEHFLFEDAKPLYLFHIRADGG